MREIENISDQIEGYADEVAKTVEREKEIMINATIADYDSREKLKILAELTGIDDFKILSYWSRSVEASRFNPEHPDYLEYKKHYGLGDVNWLEKGKTYVDMRKYKICKK